MTDETPKNDSSFPIGRVIGGVVGAIAAAVITSKTVDKVNERNAILEAKRSAGQTDE